MAATNQKPQPIFTGSLRWWIAAVLIAGPLFQALEFLLEGESGEGAARVAVWAANPSRIGLAMTFGLLAIPFLLSGNTVLVTLSREYSKRLAWLGGIFILFAMIGLAGVHGYEMAAYSLVQAGDKASAISVLDGNNLGLPGAVLLIMFLVCAVLGVLTMSAASEQDSFFVEKFSHGGMSSGHIAPQFWREQVIPLIQIRYSDSINK